MNEITQKSSVLYAPEIVHPGQTIREYPNTAAPAQQPTLNPYISAATPLLILMVQIKKSDPTPDITLLRNQIINEIKLFEQKLIQLNRPKRGILAARYCLCTAIDEAVLSTTWGTQTIWVQHSLLSHFHQETWGGERFYLIVEQLAKDTQNNLQLLELLYLLLSLGFEGKFFEKGKVIREEIRNRLYQRIRQSKGKSTRVLAMNVKDLSAILQNKHKNSSLKWLSIITISLLLLCNIGFNIGLSIKATPLIHKYQQAALESPITAYSQLLDRPIVNHSNSSGESS